MLEKATLLFLTLANPSPQDPAAPPAMTELAAHSTNTLGLALYRELGRTKADENLFLSPFSLTVALTMLAEGAREETAEQMLKTLRLANTLQLPEAHSGFAALTRRFAAGGGDASPAMAARIASLRQQLEAANREAEAQVAKQAWREGEAAARRAEKLAQELNTAFTTVGRYELRIGNALWPARQLQLVPAFVSTLTRYYGTEGAIPVDYAAGPEAARARINAWVAERTNGRIKEMIGSGQISPDTALVITNAVWFRGEWQTPFLAELTRDEAFHLAGGSSTPAPLMHNAWCAARYAAFEGDGSWFLTPQEVPADPQQKQPQKYPGDAGFTMLELPYKGRDLAMVVLVPRSADGLPRLESLLSAKALDRWLARLESRAVDTTLLRFVQRSRFDARSALEALGMQRAFTAPPAKDAAQFAGIGAGPESLRPLYVECVQHEACIELTEKGTEAAAATALLVSVTAAMPDVQTVPFVPVFRTDRPFVYLIRDVRSGAILFLGRMLDPRT